MRAKTIGALFNKLRQNGDSRTQLAASLPGLSIPNDDGIDEDAGCEDGVSPLQLQLGTASFREDSVRDVVHAGVSQDHTFGVRRFASCAD